ncbi:hypothetical protein KJ705_00945 [Patescibacteria group bacterium]|nr:hypothetical protein [Patescibacteria group bacterium]
MTIIRISDIFGALIIIFKRKEVVKMNGWYNFRKDLLNVPHTEGVYLLSESDAPGIENAIYCGKADDIHDRLSSHPDPNNPCLQQKNIRYFAYEEINDSEARERELIDAYDFQCNRV